ncbi:DGQHR domain-containing protein [Pedobacter panaciterrae]|uniref:DGQHR domain-containing protein n=1 Tax=Pedobacter panaciterrae TaxID=363849 RepID=UPI00155DC48A|nr:DGQHR domain-containing protein [Pedobacter panaciterrae]NQX56672.1 DGQHR domain-containing protein [Pedobacter panaciterrae]
MNDAQKETLLSKLISDLELKSELAIRKNAYEISSVIKTQKEQYLENGWIIDKEFKTKVRLKRFKPVDVRFEDKVWTLLANLGFGLLNDNRKFNIPCDNEGNVQELDVIAIDEEAILLVKCEASEANKKGDFRKDLEDIKQKMGGIRKSIQKLFPESKRKVKLLFVTQNYYVGEVDKELLSNIGALHLDEEAINYFGDLFTELGLAARYQLLGNLFENQEIPEIDNKIPAIQGKMGGHTYYSFSIEPEKLLKIAYVLHRNKANRKMMPTYQRIIKKARLQSVHEFIDNEKGYFPNSIIISLDSGSKPLQFDMANTQIKSAISNIGILHLPKKYRSAYVIDGQHRLYGYANSEYKNKNAIPVVAFVDLQREEQVKLFMQINENQKAVPKNLKNILNIDLLWTSDNISGRLSALKSRMSVELGENRESALFDRIIIDENTKSNLRCITTDTIIRALGRTNFLGKVTKTKIETPGTFFNGDLDDCFDRLSDYIVKCYNHVNDALNEEQRIGEQGFIYINKGVYAFLMLLGDIVDYLIDRGISTSNTKIEILFNESKKFLDPIIDFYNKIKPAEVEDLKSKHGSGGDTKYWRTLQIAVRESHSDFIPTGLEEYLKKEAREYNTEAFEYIRDIETFFKKDFKEKLESHFGASWFKKGVPPETAKKANELAFDKNMKIENEELEVDEWDCLTIIAYRAIALKNWRDIFEKDYTRPEEIKLQGGKEAKTAWMVRLERLRNENVHNYSVTQEEFDFLQSLHEWLISRSQ